MAIVKKEIDYAKELGDVGVLLEGLIRDIRAKKDAGQIAAGNLQKLIDVIQGVELLDDEVRENRRVALQTLGLHLGDIVDAVLGVPVQS